MSSKHKPASPPEDHADADSAVDANADRCLLELTVLVEIGQLMTSALDVSDVYERFAQLTAQMLQFDRIAIA